MFAPEVLPLRASLVSGSGEEGADARAVKDAIHGFGDLGTIPVRRIQVREFIVAGVGLLLEDCDIAATPAIDGLFHVAHDEERVVGLV